MSTNQNRGRWGFTLLILLGLILVLPAGAQDAVELPLVRLLALVPDVPELRLTLVSYADYRAMEAVRGIDTPTAEDFTNLSELSAQWFAASMGLSGGIPLHYLLLYLEHMPSMVGFGFFDIDRALIFGNPPAMGTVLEGSFDRDSIAAAYSTRNFTENMIEGITVWCGPAGCDSGTRVDPAGRELGNPFGGDLGRKEPLAVFSETLLANSAVLGVVEAMIASAQGEQRSLADSLDYGSIAEALHAAGTVAQVQFVNPLEFTDSTVIMQFQNGQGDAVYREIISDYGPLPPFALAALADVGTEDSQIAIIALAYANPEAAQHGAEEVAARLSTFVSPRAQRPFSDYLDDLDAVIGVPYVYESETTGWAVAIVPVHYPLPSNEPSEDTPRYAASSLIYRQFVNELYARGLYFLAMDLVR